MADGEWINCWKCKTLYFLPRALYVSAKANSKISFFCPFGHSAHYPDGPTDEDKLRQERDRLKQETARLEESRARLVEERDAAERRAAAARGQVTKLKRRAANGVCPCCSRHFTNLERHMKSKHAEYTKLEVIDGGKAA